MHKSNRAALFNLPLFYRDLIFIFLSYIVSCTTLIFMKSDLNISGFINSIRSYSWIIILYVPLVTLIMMALDMYNSTTFNYIDRIIKNTLFAAIISGLFIAVIMNFIKESMTSISILILFVLVNILFIVFQRCTYILAKKSKTFSSTKEVIVVGNPEVYEKFQYYVQKTSIKVNVKGYVSIKHKDEWDKNLNIIGNIEELQHILTNTIVDEVIFTMSNNEIANFEEYIALCEERGVTARVILDIFNLRNSKVHVSDIGNLPVITLHTVSLNNVQLTLKRLMDIIGALIGITIAIPIGIVTALAIKIDSRGPIFFSQKRVGVNGRVFKLYKFRSMYIDAEKRKEELAAANQVEGGLMFKIKDDPRITKVGDFLRKTSVDELPQFINVLMGDMSLVGTRPPTLDEVEKYDIRHWRRISIKPGITGMWQISGRSSITDFDEVVRLDTQYIDKWTVWKDIEIILKTIIVVVFKRGAY